MSLQTLEELITAEILALRIGRCFCILLQKTNLLKKKIEGAQH